MNNPTEGSTLRWRSLWLLLPPLYGVWLLGQQGRIQRYQRLYRLLALCLVVLPTLGLLGFGALAAVGLGSADALLALLVKAPWLPLLCTALLVWGTVLPALGAGLVLGRQPGQRNWPLRRKLLLCCWPLAPQALHPPQRGAFKRKARPKGAH